ncbi:MAG: hypothetical protein WCB18_08690 [Thermoplasmata archaeon]
MAGAARAVRIRRDTDGSIAVETPTGTAQAVASRAAGQRFTNSAGSTRALRTFLMFLIALAAIYAVFMEFAVTSAATGANTTVEAVLTAAVAIALIFGWWVTLGQAPTVAYVQGDKLVVHERTGHHRRFPLEGLRVTLLRSNSRGLLGPDATEFVELSIAGGVHHTYLVGTHFFDFAH